VLVLRPIIERLRERGHEVVVTSRDYTQIQELLALDGWSIRRSKRRPGGPASR
jgi:predicted glycosyltransferase